MKREKGVLIVLLLLLLSPSDLFSQHENSVRVALLVLDHYTGDPLPSAHVELYHGFSMLAAGYSDASGFIELDYIVTGNDNLHLKEDEFHAGYIKPNPFSSEAIAEFSQKIPGVVSAEIFDLYGRRVVSANKFLDAGLHTIKLSVPDLIPGIYFLNLKADEGLPKTFKLMKLGANTGGSNRISFIQDAQNHPDFLFESQPLTLKKTTTTDCYIRVSKENYGMREQDIYYGRDTALTVPLNRNNKVVLQTIDQEGNPHDMDIMVSGAYFNLPVITPATLTMPSGKYIASSEKGFFRPFKEIFEIPSVDTTICIPVEKVGSIVYNIENPDNDLLFVSEAEDGTAFYYYGLRDNAEKSFSTDFAAEGGGITATHLMTRNRDKTITTVIYNEEYYPIMWMHPTISIGVRRLGKDFNPEKAAHSFIYSASEDTATLNISPGNLYELIDWLEDTSGEDYGFARNFLNNKAGTFESILKRALTSGEEQGFYIRVAKAFTTLAAARAFADYFKEDNVSALSNSSPELRSASATMAIQAKTIPGKLAGDAVKNALAEHIDTFEVNRDGMTVPVFLCKGASKYAQICQFMYFTGTVSQCLVRCVVTLDCFTDICMPDVMNVQQAFNIRKNY